MNFLIIRVGMSVVPSVIDIIQLINMYVCVCVSVHVCMCWGKRGQQSLLQKNKHIPEQYDFKIWW